MRKIQKLLAAPPWPLPIVTTRPPCHVHKSVTARLRRPQDVGFRFRHPNRVKDVDPNTLHSQVTDKEGHTIQDVGSDTRRELKMQIPTLCIHKTKRATRYRIWVKTLNGVIMKTPTLCIHK
ncbi:hypothetical protein BaRGS_00025167 [Batillaria attramentaria]|uniref:Uncharacterized protein n=1 Tax=Batillaria attramentaria TaxID=370345 RepID=A0ABD0K939_9CAEN